MTGVIRGTGSYVPDKILDNKDLAQIMDTNDEWIRERTGIARRHVAEDDTTVSMSVRAAKRALENAGLSAEEIDLILVSTLSSNVILPCTACEVQRELGAVHAACFDLNAACSGFLFALNTAQAYLHAGMARTALVIGAECLSSLMDWTDRGTAILFGDGAGAAVLTAQEGELFPVVMHSDGRKGNALTCTSRFAAVRAPFPPREPAGPDGSVQEQGISETTQDMFIQMNGQEVFKFALRQVPECIEELLELCGRKTEEIDLFLLHQANRRIVESVARRLHADIERFPMNLEEYGNTSSASIPILLDELNRKGILKKGMKLVLTGFGAGLSWGAAYVEWQ